MFVTQKSAAEGLISLFSHKGHSFFATNSPAPQILACVKFVTAPFAAL
jgi:hypothetical protein